MSVSRFFWKRQESPKNKEVFSAHKVSFEEFVKLCQENSCVTNTSAFSNYTREIIVSFVKDIKKIFSLDRQQMINVLLCLLILYPKCIFAIVSSPTFNNIYDEIRPNIDPNVLNDYGNNFLFDITKFDDLIMVLNSDINVEINHLNYLSCPLLTYFVLHNKINMNQLIDLIHVLKRRHYDFNNSFIFYLPFTFTTDQTERIKLLMIITEIPTLDITLDLSWLRKILAPTVVYNEDSSILDLFNIILNRDDYRPLLYKIILQDGHPEAESLLMKIIRIISKIDVDKLKQMLEFWDHEKRNTFIHFAAIFHYKRLLHYIMNLSVITIHANSEGKFPAELYTSSKLVNSLKTIEKK